MMKFAVVGYSIFKNSVVMIYWPRLPHPCAGCAQEPALSGAEGVGFHCTKMIITLFVKLL